MFDVRAEVFFEFIEDWPRASTRPERMEWLDRELQHYKEQFCQEQFFDDEDEHGVWTRYWIDLPAETLAERERALLHRIAFWMEKAKEKLDHVQGKEPIENPADVPDGRRARATLISEKKLKAIEARIVEWRGWDTYAHLTDKEIEAKAFKEEKLSDSVIAQHLGIARKSVYDRRQSADRKLNRAFNTYGKRR
jgi:hypothetical protein